MQLVAVARGFATYQWRSEPHESRQRLGERVIANVEAAMGQA
jgi:hypothetical protein